MPLREAIEHRYPHASERIAALRESLIAACQRYIDTGLGDRDAERRLCSIDNSIYWQQLAEVLVAHQLELAGVRFFHPAEGPDFCVEHEGRRIWIEVITPTPANVPEAWLAPPGGDVRDFPHEAILLRWTAAIKEKAEKLLGNDRGQQGYLASGVVAADDAYVIAISPRLLRGYEGAFDCIDGISQFPFAVEATFAIGPLQVRFNRETLEASVPERQRRMLIPKPKGEAVPADTFLDHRFTPVSAIWAIDADEGTLLGKVPPSAIVHNPLATNPVPTGLLPAQDEYVARILDEDNYQLERIDCRLPPVEEMAATVER
ncbi:hypothetical protein [Mesorhizobium sp.]|uniref:hypothetical protein n=1 Tax=Mesorhizobium sp. TaxID=1871066 RepID=UPI00121102C3|nr:hypothetical protein [Mesorhizobium sp.]TIO06362.1 MAG: hypothetical protein E5X88_23595 [Mesorhizobium sp.]TIO30740.1 MAG: hypothetical protein E5X89_25855 [Mesorhizobium sp.]TIP09902.1 MAG: hypothetical protein E5X73_24460 [Mesorhizobium sp.]